VWKLLTFIFQLPLGGSGIISAAFVPPLFFNLFANDRPAESGSEESLDGEPLGEPASKASATADSPPPPSAAPKPAGFVASKWETVDPEQVGLIWPFYFNKMNFNSLNNLF
jgi:hypothetical protein